MPGRRQRILISKTRIWPHSCTDKDIQYIHTHKDWFVLPTLSATGQFPLPKELSCQQSRILLTRAAAWCDGVAHLEMAALPLAVCLLMRLPKDKDQRAPDHLSCRRDWRYQ